MRSAAVDLMAGERARTIQERPDKPVLVQDPTDPRCGQAVASGEMDRPRPWSRDPTGAGVRGSAPGEERG
jgi:hypothetical protein